MRLIGTLLLLLATLPLAAGADWIVTKEGGRVETRGPWKVKGNLVVFYTHPEGTFSSMRLSEVDLDKSAQATYEAENPPAVEEVEAPQETVLELTDKDIARAAPPPPQPVGPGNLDRATTPEGVSINAPYNLLNWNLQTTEAGSIEIRGTLVYEGDEERVDGLNMVVSLSTADGVQFAQTSAALTTAALRQGAATTFRAVFNDVEVEDYRVGVEVESREPR